MSVQFSIRQQNHEFLCRNVLFDFDERTAMVELSEKKGGYTAPLKVGFEDLMINNSHNDGTDNSDQTDKDTYYVAPDGTVYHKNYAPCTHR